MKKLPFIRVIVLLNFLLYGCVFRPLGSVTELEPGRYSIDVSEYGTCITNQIYQEWEKKARDACNGDFEVIDRHFVEECHLVGVVKCK